MKLELIMLLLPVVFMLHEYEEIIMFRHWLDRNRDELKRRFPKFERFLARRRHFDYSTATFAIGTAHEFILISLISFCAVWLGAYQWWFAAFAGYSFHLIVHLAQWTIYRKYFWLCLIVSMPLLNWKRLPFYLLYRCSYGQLSGLSLQCLVYSLLFSWWANFNNGRRNIESVLSIIK